MKTFRTLFLFLLFAAGVNETGAQVIGKELGGEDFLYAETKQVNQFFRRFNCEEDLDGNRLYYGDSLYRDPNFREKYINMLFDQQTKAYDDSIKRHFLNDVLDQKEPIYLDFYEDKWFAEVKAKFRFNGKVENAVIFLSLEREGYGIKWVITNIFFQPFNELFFADSTLSGKFLHPMSHELDFMNLIKVFNDTKAVEYYFENTYQPDFRSIFIYELKKGGLKFETITDVRFHFFQVDNWYFEVSEFNRSGYNRGWLISSLMEVPEGQKEILLKYIYYEQ